ncbi:MAG: hypothetical protein DRR42_22635 [Gammaproteobacteria bacterium]|nr:MAG: hypothetical protein DRR42_22635 [Gammaproteobacteria bacterium]
MKKIALMMALTLVSTSSWAQESDEKLELMQRHIEALEEQNRLLQEQVEKSNAPDNAGVNVTESPIESYEPELDKLEEQAGASLNQVGSNQIEPPTKSGSDILPTSESSGVNVQRDDLLLDQLLTAAKRGSIGSSEFAALYNYYEIWFCREIANSNITKMKNNGQAPGAYERILEAIEVWEYGIPTWSAGVHYGTLKEKMEKMEMRDRITITRWGVYHEDPMSARDSNLHMTMTSYAQSTNALKHCAETMPTNKREANSRYSQAKSMSKKLWKGDKKAFLSFDSVLSDRYQILQDYDRRNTDHKEQAKVSDKVESWEFQILP